MKLWICGGGESENTPLRGDGSGVCKGRYAGPIERARDAVKPPFSSYSLGAIQS